MLGYLTLYSLHCGGVIIKKIWFSAHIYQCHRLLADKWIAPNASSKNSSTMRKMDKSVILIEKLPLMEWEHRNGDGVDFRSSPGFLPSGESLPLMTRSVLLWLHVTSPSTRRVQCHGKCKPELPDSAWFITPLRQHHAHNSSIWDFRRCFTDLIADEQSYRLWSTGTLFFSDLSRVLFVCLT